MRMNQQSQGSSVICYEHESMSRAYEAKVKDLQAEIEQMRSYYQVRIAHLERQQKLGEETMLVGSFGNRARITFGEKERYLE